MAYIKVRVKAGARKERVVAKADDTYIIEVREKPERGEANKRVRELLAEALHAQEAHVRLVKGSTSPSKIYSCT